MIGQAVTGLVLGFGLGVFFFGGLWLTVRRLPGTGSPRLLAVGSYLVRMSVACAGFLLAGKAGGLCLAVACLSFVAVRVALQLKVAPWKVQRGEGNA